MALSVKDGTLWSDAWARCLRLAPEAFQDDRVLNLWGGRWRPDGLPQPAVTPVDGTAIAGPPRLGVDAAQRAVRAALDAHRQWRHVPLPERKARVTAAVDALTEHRELLALLLVWEIGKPWRLAQADVDRAISGVRWYLANIDRMVEGRAPLDGPVSNIASWNYPMSVLVHAMLVQTLAGNAVIAKTPTDGGLACLILACALAARAGLPVTLISGSGGELSKALVQSPEIGCVSFVGGTNAGGRVADALSRLDKRHILEQEGLNCWGLWDFSDWEGFGGQIRKTFEYAKQRCTAYPRFVVQRELFADFLSVYLPAVRSVAFGHPLAVADPGDPLPAYDFGPLINAHKAKELRGFVDDAINRGAVPLHHGRLSDGVFLPGQDTSAYFAPVLAHGGAAGHGRARGHPGGRRGAPVEPGGRPAEAVGLASQRYVAVPVHLEAAGLNRAGRRAGQLAGAGARRRERTGRGARRRLRAGGGRGAYRRRSRGRTGAGRRGRR
jgi:acyl-CoA reductase-like NAD-dependent aldehyde dehydrogenase